MPLDTDLTTQEQPEQSLRDTLAENLRVIGEGSTDDAATDKNAVVAPVVDKAAAPVDTSTETATQKADRIRDEQGRFAPGKTDASVKNDAGTVNLDAQAATKPVVEPPSTWNTQEKAAFREAPAQVQQAIIRREADYARGVSTYKGEYDRVKPLDDVVQQFVPMLGGRDPAEWVSTLGNVHKTFAYGAPQEKLNALLKLAQEYNVPLSQHIAQGGQVPQFNPNAAQPQQVVQPPQDVRAVVQAELQMYQSQQAIKSFQDAKDATGNPRYPHFSTVRDDMIGLLQAGLATDLEGAYNKAIRTHDDIWQQEQTAKAQADAATQAAERKAKVDRAKRNAVSVTGSTPNNTQAAGDKGLRETIRENLAAVAGGRV